MAIRKVFLVSVAVLAVGFASSASAATSWKHLGANPFSRPALSSEADLRSLVQTRGADLKAGFATAGDPELYPAFVEQFPTATIDTVKVAPGETFAWMVFKKQSSRKVAVLKDVTWKGAAPFDAFRFHIDYAGRRHEFVVPFVCGNVALRSIGAIPPAPAAAVLPSRPAPAPAPAPVAAAPIAAPAPVVAPPQAVASALPAPVAPPPAPFAPQPVALALAAPVPVAPVCVPEPPPPPPARPIGGLLFDVGLSRQPDPANYLFARLGYELPLSEQLYLIGLVGGSLRWMGNDGGSALTADVLLDYHWLDGFSFGAGAGFWSGNDGQIDAIVDVGYLLSGSPDGNNLSLFAEARLPLDELDSPNEFGRIGLGLRFRF